MQTLQTPPIRPTVSRAFVQDWLRALETLCPPQQLTHFLSETGLAVSAGPRDRVTHDQIVRLYQLAAVETGDEMMGLWTRPIRSGALKNLCSYMRGASSLSAALFRFTSFWNMLLDDFSVVLDQGDDDGVLLIRLVPRDQAMPQRFGHMLLLKLAHGIASWLAGRELRLGIINFGFARPDFAEDYPILFPALIRFGQAQSSIVFADDLSTPPTARSEADMQEFLLRAPRDWIFTDYREHALPLRLREMLLRSDRMSFRLRDAAEALNMTERTLMRRLDDEATSFQAIKDGVRRDIALRDLASGGKSIEAISQELGFSSAANFHRAFKTWTGMTPGTYGAHSK